MDILGPLTPFAPAHASSSSDKYKYILLVVDSFTGWIEGFPLVSQSAETVAFLLYSEIFCRYGAPECIISDQGANFMSQLVQSLCELFQVARHRTSAYKPACNGRVEVMNNILGKSLRAHCEGCQEKWVNYLPGILLGLRMSVNSTTQYSPFYLMFGRTMRIPIDCALLPKDFLSISTKQHLSEIQDAIKVSVEVAKENTTKAKEKQKQQHDKKAEIPDFKIGQKVMLENFKTPRGQSRKLSNKFIGPFTIHEYGPNFTYKLRQLSDNKILADLIHSNRLKAYFDESHRTTPDPQQVHLPHNPIRRAKSKKNVQGPTQNWHAVERILGTKRIQGQAMYKIKWKDCDETSYEPKENIHQSLLHQYHQTHTLEGKKRKNIQKYRYFTKAK